MIKIGAIDVREDEVNHHDSELQAVQPFARAVAYSLQGVVYAFHTEQNVKRDVWLFTVLCAVELVLRPPLRDVALTMFVAMCVFAAELFNTAIELAVDIASQWQHHVVAGVAKDVASGAVTCVSLGAIALAIWLVESLWPWHFWLFTGHHPAGAGMVVTGLIVVWAFRCWPYRQRTVIKRRRKGDEHGV